MIAWLQIDGGADGCSVALVRDRRAMASQAADRAMPLLSGEMGSDEFTVTGSPLRG